LKLVISYVALDLELQPSFTFKGLAVDCLTVPPRNIPATARKLRDSTSFSVSHRRRIITVDGRGYTQLMDPTGGIYRDRSWHGPASHHLNIGAGRIVRQDIVRIDVSVKKRQFHKSPNIVASMQRAKDGNSRLHLLGLVSCSSFVACYGGPCSLWSKILRISDAIFISPLAEEIHRSLVVVYTPTLPIFTLSSRPQRRSASHIPTSTSSATDATPHPVQVQATPRT